MPVCLAQGIQCIDVYKRQAFHFRLGTEGLVDDEVVVAFESMAVDAGVIISRCV